MVKNNNKIINITFVHLRINKKPYLLEEVLENNHYHHRKAEGEVLALLIVTEVVEQDLVKEQLGYPEYLE